MSHCEAVELFASSIAFHGVWFGGGDTINTDITETLSPVAVWHGAFFLKMESTLRG